MFACLPLMKANLGANMTVLFIDVSYFACMNKATGNKFLAAHEVKSRVDFD